MKTDESPFVVELWDMNETRVEQLVATASDMMVAIAALDVAAERYPKRTITLRRRAGMQRTEGVSGCTVPGV